MLKRLVYAFIVCGFVTTVAGNDSSPYDPQTLEQASYSQGLVSAVQLKASKPRLLLNEFEAGLRKSYSEKLDAEQLQEVETRSAVLSATAKSGQTRSESKQLAEASFHTGLLTGVSSQQRLKQLDFVSFMRGFQFGYTEKVKSSEIARATIRVDTFYKQQRLDGAEERLAQSKAFLEKNAVRKGVKITKSGLQYEVLKEGEGRKITVDDSVKVHYIHFRPDGTVLDNSYERNFPVVYPMYAEIPEGWRELLLLMSKGARYKAYLSPKLAYGEEGYGDEILPNQLLISEFEILELVPPPEQPYTQKH